MRSEASSPIERLAFAAVCLAVLTITWNGFRVGGGAVANAFLVPAFLIVAARTALLRKPIPLPPWMFAAAIGFALAAMLRFIFPPDSSLLNDILVHYRTIPQAGDAQPLILVPRSDLLALFQFETGLVVIPILIASVATTTRRIERLLDVFVFSAAINAAVGILDFAGLHIAPLVYGTGRSAGLTIHPNYLALTCTIAIPLALLWVGRSGRWRPAGFAFTGLLLAGAYASGSRAGAVTAILGVLATMIVIPRLRTGLGFTVPIVGMILLALIYFAGDEILKQIRLTGDVGTAVNTAGSDTQRSQLAHLALQQFQARPVQGVGFSVIADAHSIYLQLLAAGGLIAFFSFLTYLGGLAASAWRAFSGPLRDVAAAISVSIVMWLINGAIDNQLGDKYLYVLPGLLIALAYVTRAAQAEEPEPVTGTARAPALAPPMPAGQAG
jgi:O-antigen ligase/polysaccharide polymerase Wzy-like membrane protein